MKGYTPIMLGLVALNLALGFLCSSPSAMTLQPSFAFSAAAFLLGIWTAQVPIRKLAERH